MPVSAEKTVKTIIQKIKDTFDGFGEEAVEEFYNIMIGEVRTFSETLRKETLASVAQSGGSEPEQPSLKRVTNYTMFGLNFRKENPTVKENVFQEIAKAWKKLSADQKAEWKTKANEENAKLKEAYLEQYGELPKKNRRKNRPKTTNPFQEYVKEFRVKNPKVGHRDVFREASKAWGKMSDKQKKKYVEQADTLRTQYRADFEEQQRLNPQVEDVGGKRKKRPRKERPKTKSGYIVFGNHWRAKLNSENLTGQGAMSALADAWKKLSEKDQAKYKTQATKENEAIVSSFLKEHPESEWATKHSPQSASA